MRNLFNRNKTEEIKAHSPAESVMDTARLKEIIGFFPIGTKVQYCPMFMEKILLDSIILGYSINGHIVYSDNEYDLHNADNKTSFTIYVNRQKKTIQDVVSFDFVVPNDKSGLSKLDLISKAALGKQGQFAKNKDIALISGSAAQRGVAEINTYVKKTIKLKDGFYANHEVVLLEALPHSFTTRDQRHHARIDTNIPITLNAKNSDSHYECFIKDFSEDSFRISFNPSAGLNLDTFLGKKVTLNIGDNNRGKTYILSGAITRVNQGNIVVILEGIKKGHQFVKPELIDLLDIKSNLLRYPETHETLQDRH